MDGCALRLAGPGMAETLGFSMVTHRFPYCYPYAAHGQRSAGDVETNFKMSAILRLLMKNVRIPVVTALETLAGEVGRI